MEKLTPYKFREAKISYVLYPFERVRTYKEGIHYPLERLQKSTGKRESCRITLRSHEKR